MTSLNEGGRFKRSDSSSSSSSSSDSDDKENKKEKLRKGCQCELINYVSRL